MYFVRQANFNLNNSNLCSNPEISLGGKGGGEVALAVSARLRGLVYFLPLNLSRTSGRVEYKTRPRSEASPREPRRVPKVLGNRNLHFHHPRDSALLLFHRCGYVSSLSSTPSPSPSRLPVSWCNQRYRTYLFPTRCNSKTKSTLHRAIARVDGGIIFALLPSRRDNFSHRDGRVLVEFATKIASRPHHIYRTDFPVITSLPPFCVK